MIRTLCLIALAVSAAALFLPATANPLAQIKEAANQSRDSAEEHSEKVAEQAEQASGEHDHGDHAHHEEAEHGGSHHAHHEAHEAHGEAPHHADDHDASLIAQVSRGVAVMLSTEGHSVRGIVVFTQTDNGVIVTADISGLTPHQKHGFHIHEFGNISDPAGKATGGHYNPESHDHAMPSSDHAGHAGDLGNLQADAQGNAIYEETFVNISLGGAKNPILGRGVIIHAQPDDGSQPTGNAGARIAQGVIGVAQ